MWELGGEMCSHTRRVQGTLDRIRDLSTVLVSEGQVGSYNPVQSSVVRGHQELCGQGYENSQEADEATGNTSRFRSPEEPEILIELHVRFSFHVASCFHHPEGALGNSQWRGSHSKVCISGSQHLFLRHHKLFLHPARGTGLLRMGVCSPWY